MTAGSAQVRTIARNTVFNGLSQAASVTSTLVFLPLVIAASGAGDYGVLVIASSLGSWALLFDFGISAAITSSVARASALGDHDAVTRTIASGAAVYTLIGLFWALVLGVVAPLLAGVFGFDAAETTLFTRLMMVSAASHAVYWTGLARRDALGGLQRYDLTSRVALLLVAAELVGAAAVVFFGAPLLVLGIVRAVALASTTLVYRGLYGRAYGRHAPLTRADRGTARALLAAGIPVFTLQIAQVLNRQQADRIIIGVALGPAFVTIYEVAAKLGSLVVSFTGVLSSALLPAAARLEAGDRPDTLLALFERGSHLIALVVAPVVAGLIVVAPTFLTLWGGESFSASAVPARLLLMAQLFVPLYIAGDSVLISKGRFSAWVPGGVTLAALNVVLSMILVRVWGVTGVAVGTLVSTLAESVWYMRVFSAETGLSVGSWLRKTVVPLYLLLLVPVGIAAVGVRTPLAESLWGLALVGGTCVCAYWALAFRFTVPRMWRTQLVASLAPRSAR